MPQYSIFDRRQFLRGLGSAFLGAPLLARSARAQNAPSGDSAERRRAMARIAALEWHPKPPPRHAARWSPLDELPDWLATALDSVVPPGAAAAWSAWAQQGDNLSLAHAMQELHAWTCAAAMEKRP